MSEHSCQSRSRAAAIDVPDATPPGFPRADEYGGRLHALKQNVSALIMSTMQHVAPRTAFRVSRFRKIHDEPELRLLPLLVDHEREAVDVGANVGRYAYPLAQLARRVHVFEPHPRLARMLKASLPRNCSVRNEAVSDRETTTVLRIPAVDGRRNEGLAYLGARNELGSVHDISVPTTVLDSIADRPIGFVKIDVEGHEHCVLQGALRLVQLNRPTFLVEAENKHTDGAVEAVFDYFSANKYVGFFLAAGKLRSTSTFRAEMQDPKILEQILGGSRRVDATYINNFIFVPAERRDSFQAAAKVFGVG